MLISNASRYDTQELARLIRYAFRGVPAGNVGIQVIDQEPQRSGFVSAGSAVARDGVGQRSPFYREAGIRRSVIIRLGPPEAYPSDNLVRTLLRRRNIPMRPHIFTDAETGQSRNGSEAMEYVRGMLIGNEEVISINRRSRNIVVAEIERRPYGGNGSPYFEYLDWREGVIAFAAHEARHIWQFAQREKEVFRQSAIRRRAKLTPLSEVDAERHALRVLTCFRRERQEVLLAPMRMAAKRSQRDDIPLYGIARLLAPFPEDG